MALLRLYSAFASCVFPAQDPRFWHPWWEVGALGVNRLGLYSPVKPKRLAKARLRHLRGLQFSL